MPSDLFSRVFWLDALVRTISTAATTTLGVLTAGGFKLIPDVPWYGVLSAGALAALAEFLRALSTLKIGPGQDNGTASFLSEVVAAPKDA
jgi:hypothetical protein